MDARQKEIRTILSGLVSVDGDKIVAAKNIYDLVFQGLYDGSVSARIFGLTVRRKQYKFRMKSAEAKNVCAEAFQKLGRSIMLRTAPDALAVLCFPLLHNPCVMTVDMKGSNALVSFYAAKTARSFLNARRGFSKLKRNLQDGIYSETEITIIPQVIEIVDDQKSEAEDQ